VDDDAPFDDRDGAVLEPVDGLRSELLIVRVVDRQLRQQRLVLVAAAAGWPNPLLNMNSDGLLNEPSPYDPSP
jgi:hypothetical protein